MTTQPSQITVLALDVDGVLTDGRIAFDPVTNKELKFFHVHDGLGITLWQRVGFHVILLSGRSAKCVALRAEELQIPHIIQHSTDKIAELDRVLSEIGCTPEQTCFVGDDLGDIPVMQHVGYAIAVHNAVQEVKTIADWMTTRNGGDGAVREVIEHLMVANNTWDQALESIQTEHANQ